MKENKSLKEAYNKLEQISQDEQMQRLAELRQKAIWDRNTAVNTGFRKRHGSRCGKAAEKSGMEAGIEKRQKRTALKLEEKSGSKNEKIETAKRLLKNGIEISIIAIATGLSATEIKKLKID